MKPTTFILVLLIAALLVTPVAAVTYSEEYYKLSDMLGNYNSILHNGSVFSNGDHYQSSGVSLDMATYYELRRQTILMEKQNELLEEQNGLMRTQMGMKLQCTRQGLAAYGGCLEYAWVDKNTPIPTGW